MGLKENSMTDQTDKDAELQQFEASSYAVLLGWGTHIGLAALVLSFAAYVFGFIAPLVPLDQLPALWNQPVAQYLQSTGTPKGWHWFSLIGKGDMLNLVGICVLAGCSIPALLGLIPLYLKQRDYIYAGMCALIALVLLLAASGFLTGGH
jgi:hypothetical protein